MQFDGRAIKLILGSAGVSVVLSCYCCSDPLFEQNGSDQIIEQYSNTQSVDQVSIANIDVVVIVMALVVVLLLAAV